MGPVVDGGLQRWAGGEHDGSKATGWFARNPAVSSGGNDAATLKSVLLLASVLTLLAAQSRAAESGFKPLYSVPGP